MNRREFALALAGTALTFGKNSTWAQASQATPNVLTVSRRTIEVKGRPASVYGITGPGGKPGLEILLGERFNVRVRNGLDAETILHWHGLTPPYGQDGVVMPGHPAIPPGQSQDYNFTNIRSGTHWMHSHVGLQEQQLLAAPLIVRGKTEAAEDEQQHVVMLHDFSFRDPAEILAELQAGGGGHAGHMMQHGSMEHSDMEQGQTMAMGGPVMLNDVRYDAYLANDRTLDDPEVVAVEKGGALRLRIINGAAASNLWIDLGGLEGELIAVDGNDIVPLKGSRFPLAIAQRADIRIRIPQQGGAFPILFRPEGVAERTGIIIATAGAAVPRIEGAGEMTPAVDLSQEFFYRPLVNLVPEPVSRTEMLMLTGGDQGYNWGFNGEPSMHRTLFNVRQGERISLMMHNMTGMAHPMHLHGHHFKVTNIAGKEIDGALRDVVLVPPMEMVTITFDADNPGTWPFHCHHLYHMNSGMMGMIGYASAA